MYVLYVPTNMEIMYRLSSRWIKIDGEQETRKKKIFLVIYESMEKKLQQ